MGVIFSTEDWREDRRMEEGGYSLTLHKSYMWDNTDQQFLFYYDRSYNSAIMYPVDKIVTF